jgi:L-threonylcarbamoyladenylate synthase
MGRSVSDAVRTLRSGGLVVYPTDTLVGLGARATDPRAVRRVGEAKGRPARRPMSIAVSSTEEVERFAALSRSARQFVRRHLPGPFTILARPTAEARRTLAREIAGGPTIGVRVPDHPVARELARRAGPIIATSANRHGARPAGAVEEARRLFGRRVGTYVTGAPAPSGTPSLLVDLTGVRPRPEARP